MPKFRLLPWLVLMLSALSVACSSVQVGYNYAPALLQYQMDSYLDLNDDQEALLKDELKAFQAWHRQSALPDYAQTLRQWAGSVTDTKVFSVSEVLQKQAQLEQALMTIGQRSAYRLAPLVLTLTPEQRSRLRKRFADSNAEYAEENLANPKRAQRERLDRYTERYEQWLGDLTKQQRDILRQWLDQEPSRAALWGQERMARQQALLDLLAQARERLSAEQAAISLHDYFQSLSGYRVVELQSQKQQRLTSLAQLTVDLLNSMNRKQREHLRQKLMAYADDFDALAKQKS